MALWNKTDTEAARPKWVNLLNTNLYPTGTQILFLDETESQVATNKSKGLTGPGWWVYREYLDSDSNPRYKAECLVSFATPAAVAGDAADDNVVPDAAVAIDISAQPTNQTTVLGEATFSVTAAVTPSGTATYQWQVKKAGTNNYALIDGATASTLALTGLVEADNGNRYRVLVSGSGAKSVLSTSALLTFGT